MTTNEREEKEQAIKYITFRSCPFCNSNDLDSADDSVGELDGRDWDTCYHFIQCCKCGARGPVSTYKRQLDGEFGHTANKDWNSRATDQSKEK